MYIYTHAHILGHIVNIWASLKYFSKNKILKRISWKQLLKYSERKLFFSFTKEIKNYGCVDVIQNSEYNKKNCTCRLLTLKKIMRLLNKLRSEIEFFKKGHFEIKLRLSEKLQRIGIYFCYNKWISFWKKIRLLNKRLNIVLFSTHPAGSRNHQSTEFWIYTPFQSLFEVPFLEGTETVPLKKRLCPYFYVQGC